MNDQDDIRYRALTARDSRFDGLFFVGVKTTGIYCRPICTAKTPGRARCQFFENAALAERAGFRPCLRCRPELAPGLAPVDQVKTIARQAAFRIEAGYLNHGNTVDDLAACLGISTRQLRRAMSQELGVSPVDLAQTHRLLLAKRLIGDTQLPLAQLAFAAGFESVRRFNALFQSHYRMTPSLLRRAVRSCDRTGSVRLHVSYRAPYDWGAMLGFLEARAIPGVECTCGGTYHRTVQVGSLTGWLNALHHPARDCLVVEISTPLTARLPQLLVGLRNLFDLDARPDVIAEHLGSSRELAASLQKHPGLRVPGAFDNFELCLRAKLGQQISVAAASTLAGRLAARLGEPIQTPFACLHRLSPTPISVSECNTETIREIGLPTVRAENLRQLAARIASGEIDFERFNDPHTAMVQLMALPGIGPWTAHYIAMRTMRWPDAFPSGDLGLLKASKANSAQQLETLAEQWRPWRAYAAMHLWESLKYTNVHSKELS